MNPKARHISELALIRSIPDMTIGELPPCRLKGLYVRLQKWVDKDLHQLPRISNEDLEAIEKIMDQFGEDTGWFGKQKHVGTLLSFCATMIESSEFKFHPRIMETITDIIDHLEAGKDLYFQSFWGGGIAFEKWEKLFEEVVV